MHILPELTGCCAPTLEDRGLGSLEDAPGLGGCGRRKSWRAGAGLGTRVARSAENPKALRSTDDTLRPRSWAQDMQGERSCAADPPRLTDVTSPPKIMWAEISRVQSPRPEEWGASFLPFPGGLSLCPGWQLEATREWGWAHPRYGGVPSFKMQRREGYPGSKWTLPWLSSWPWTRPPAPQFPISRG